MSSSAFGQNGDHRDIHVTLQVYIYFWDDKHLGRGVGYISPTQNVSRGTANCKVDYRRSLKCDLR